MLAVERELRPLRVIERRTPEALFRVTRLAVLLEAVTVHVGVAGRAAVEADGRRHLARHVAPGARHLGVERRPAGTVPRMLDGARSPALGRVARRAVSPNRLVRIVMARSARGEREAAKGAVLVARLALHRLVRAGQRELRRRMVERRSRGLERHGRRVARSHVCAHVPLCTSVWQVAHAVLASRKDRLLWQAAHLAAVAACTPSSAKPVSLAWSNVAWSRRRRSASSPACSVWQVTQPTSAFRCTPVRRAMRSAIGLWHVRHLAVVTLRPVSWHCAQFETPSTELCALDSGPGDTSDASCPAPAVAVARHSSQASRRQPRHRPCARRPRARRPQSANGT